MTTPIRFLLLLFFSGSIATSLGQAFTTLKSFGILTNVTGFDPRTTLVQGPDGMLYGTASEGEGNVRGTVFKLSPDGATFEVLKYFTNHNEGAYPGGDIAIAGIVLFGTTFEGGGDDYGTVFKLNIDGTGYSVLKSFTGTDGVRPSGLKLSGDMLYGITGGSTNGSVVFKMRKDGTDFAVVKEFPESGGEAVMGGLALSGSVLYGTTYVKATSGGWRIFKVNIDGTGFAVLKAVDFGNGPHSSLTLSDGVLYGTSHSGGSLGGGTVFRIKTDGTGYTVLKNFSLDGESYPWAGVILSDGVLYGATSWSGGGYGSVFKLNTNGSGYTALKEFAEGEGQPVAGLAMLDRALYGTTGGPSLGPQGRVFKVNPDGTGYAVLKLLKYSDTAYPRVGLTSSSNVIYGTTSGDVFKLNTDGTSFTVLTNLHGTYGLPNSVMILSGEVLYGTTYKFGISDSGFPPGHGTVFRVNTDGTGNRNLQTFTRGGPRGLASCGDMLFGALDGSDNSNYGVVFRMRMDGTDYTILKSFAGGEDGARPTSLMVSDGMLYGTSIGFDDSPSGTVFMMKTDGTGHVVLKRFTGGDDGAHPRHLTLSEGVLYGIADGGSRGYGTVFKLNTNGTGFTVLKYFDFGEEAAESTGPVISGRMLYGATSSTIFQLNLDGTGYSVLKYLSGKDGVWCKGITLVGKALYGTTADGGLLGEGTVFKIDLSAPRLSIRPLNESVVLSWSEPGFTLQAAPTPTGGYTNVPGATTPFTNSSTSGQRFFRLISN